MIKMSTRERDKQIVLLLDGGRREPKEVVYILGTRGIRVTRWTVYKAKIRFSKFFQSNPNPIWR